MKGLVTKMKKNSYCIFSYVLLSLILIISLCSCHTGLTQEKQIFPFTSLSFTSSYEEMVDLEGESTDTYKSVYGGTTYTYPKKYLDYDGTIKYMFNDKNQLMSVAWAYSSDIADDLYAVYDVIHSDVVEEYGDSGYNAQGDSNYGDVWELDEYHIVLSTMVTDSNKALQFGFTKVE